MTFIRKSLLTAICASLSLFFPACGKKNTPVELGIQSQILHKGNNTEPATLDPHTASGIPEWRIISALFEGLVAIDSKSLQPVPAAARAWEISPDGKTYTFFIRDEAKWSNGDPLTAHDFVFSYKRVLSRNLGCPYAYMFYDIVNAEAFHKKEIADFSQVGIKALDDLTLQIQLKHPVPYLLPMMDTLAWLPVHKDTILKYGAIDEIGSSWTRPGNLVSNGPFTLKEWEISRSVVLTRNLLYWDNATTKLNEIHFYPLEISTEERAFRTGQLHVTEAISHQKINYYKKNDPEALRITPYFADYAYAFNTTMPPFDNKNIRKALSLAIDRQSIIDNVTHKSELPAFSYTPPGVPGYEIKNRLHENTEEARRLLAQAGFPNGEGFPTIKMLYNTSESHKSIAEALQHMWAKELNIKVELINQEWKVFLKAREDKDFNLVRYGWVGDYLDVNAFLDIFTADSGHNVTGWKNKSYDNLILKANRTLNPTQRLKAMQQAEDLLMEELPVLPIYYYNTAYLVHSSVKNWDSNLMDKQNYKHVYLE